jgi:hypothetical protein
MDVSDVVVKSSPLQTLKIPNKSIRCIPYETYSHVFSYGVYKGGNI